MQGKDRRYKGVHTAVTTILQELGVDLKDSNFVETPRRISSWLLEFVREKEQVELELREFSKAIFPFKGHDLIVIDDITAYSICPHHFLPVVYKVSIAYLPNGHVVGLSKLARFAKTLARVPLLQETYVNELANSIFKYLRADGVLVLVSGEHFCMKMRGVNCDSTVMTTAIRGKFETDEALKSEAYQMLMLKKRCVS